LSALPAARAGRTAGTVCSGRLSGERAVARTDVSGGGSRAGARRRARAPLSALVLALAAAAAAAEPVQENAVSVAEDAFGLAVGNQAIGLYSIADARGFSPQQAGNLRIEGLYFDNPSAYVGPCTARATVMRIGITAQSYSFPAPTGIADLRLFTPGDATALGAVATRGPYQEATALIEGQTPLGDHLAGSACLGYSKDFAGDQARAAGNTSAGVVLRWRPSAHTEIVPFWSTMNGSQHALLPFVFSDGVEVPPLFDARALASQPFTSYGWHATTLGVVVHQGLGARWTLTAGLFHAREADRASDIEEYLSVLPDRTVDHRLDRLPPLTSSSTSGEVRLAREFGGELHTRRLDLSLRGRSADHAYGGDQLACYGTTTLDSGPPTTPPETCPPPFDMPPIPSYLDETRQLDLGAVYEERWKGVGTLGVGLLKSHYRRTVIETPGIAQGELTTPWLASLKFTVEAGHAVTLYGSFLQGLEDSAPAPVDSAVPGQPPPATRSRQVDGGLRYAPANGLSLVLGGFEIQKVYFNTDETGTYRALGTVRHRGLESSLAYAGGSGLTVVAGGVWLKPHLDRTEPAAGLGSVPIGPVPLTLSLNVDYAPPVLRPFAGSVQLARLSERTATLANDATLPPLTTASAGLRYESRLHNHPFTVRLDALNLSDARGLHLTPFGQVIPELGRRFLLSVSIDR